MFQSYPDLLPPLQSSIEVGNGEKAKVMGKGSVTIYLRVDNMKKTCQLSDILYAPDLDYNLISISSMDKKGITTIFRNSKCQLLQNGKLLATATLFRTLYKLDSEDYTKSPQSALVAQSLALWRKRLAHAEPQLIKEMASSSTVKGLQVKSKNSTQLTCAHCILGKGSRTPFPSKSLSYTSSVLELVHSDLCGPLDIPSLGGSSYFITIIDDFSRWITVYFLKNKSEALKCFGFILQEVHSDPPREVVDNSYKIRRATK